MIGDKSHSNQCILILNTAVQLLLTEQYSLFTATLEWTTISQQMKSYLLKINHPYLECDPKKPYQIQWLFLQDNPRSCEALTHKRQNTVLTNVCTVIISDLYTLLWARESEKERESVRLVSISVSGPVVVDNHDFYYLSVYSTMECAGSAYMTTTTIKTIS